MADKTGINLWISIIITIIVGIFYFIVPDYRMWLILGGIIIIIFLYLSEHAGQINALKEETKKLNEKLKIYERLSKLEARVFK